LQLICQVIVEFFDSGVLDAYFDKILSSYFRSIVHDAINFILYGEDVVEVHFGKFKALFVRDLNIPYVLIGRQLVDSHC